MAFTHFEGKLHQDDQPLENVFLGQFPPLILPSGFVKSVLGGGNDGQEAIRFGVHAVGDDPQRITGFVVINPKMHGSVPVRQDHIATAVIAPAQKHGLIRKTPQNLRQVIDVMNGVDVDLLSILRQRFRQWKDNDATTIGARVLLLLIFPKYREEGSPEETWEWDVSGFLLLDSVRDLGVKLGLWQVMPNGTMATLIGAGEDHSSDVLIQIVNPVTQLTKATAALFNGTQLDDRKLAMVGVGALGSMTLQNLVRKGFGVWTLIDDDLMMPHNGARHALPALAAGAPKVTGMKRMMDTVYEETAIITIGRVNVLRPGSEETSFTTILSQADIIFDCSADVAAARQLALDSPGLARRLSLFLSPDGEQMVMLLEDRERKIKLDALEMQFYRLLLATCCLQKHYASLVGPKIRYGRSCRDLSAVISADSIAAFAAIGSKAVERLLRDDAAAIAVWKTEPDLSVKATWNQPRREFRLGLSSFTVVWDEGVLDKMRWLRGEKLPRETGGALLGCWDLSRRILYIVDVTGAPDDSLERATAFIRGSKSLSDWIAETSRITGRSIEYVGEWHSHPNCYSTNPSGDDRKVFHWIDQHLSVDGLPPAMLIVGETELRWMSTVDGNGVAWNYPN